MFIKNNSQRLYTVQGVALVPGQETEIPANLTDAIQRDIDGMEDLEVVKQRAKPGPKPKVEVEQAPEPEAQAEAQAAQANAESDPVEEEADVKGHKAGKAK